MRARFVVEVVDEQKPNPVKVAIPQTSVSPSPVIAAPTAPIPSVPVQQPQERPKMVPQEVSPPPRVPTIPSSHQAPIAFRTPRIRPLSEMQTDQRSPEEVLSTFASRGFKSPQDVVPDPFESQSSAIKQLFQEEQIAEVREKPLVIPPKTSKRVKEQLRVQYEREQAFRSQLDNAPNESQTKIESYFQQRVPQDRKRDKSPILKEKKKLSAPKIVKKKRFLLPLATLCFLLATGVVSAAYVMQDLQKTQSVAQSLMSDLEQGRVPSAEERLQFLHSRQERYSGLYKATRPVLNVFLGDDKTSHIDKVVDLSARGIEIADQGFATYHTLEKSYQQFMGKDPGSTSETLSKVSGEMEGLFTELSHFQAELVRLDNPFGVEFIPELQKKVQVSFPSLRRGVLAAQQINYALPGLLGDSGKKQYLVLLQNNAELRPTGGFIGSFAILTVEKGRFVDFTVEDVYEADGQLNGFVSPPPELSESLGEAQWHLRDVNWSPDFPTVAQQASWFLDKTIRVKPDGVIAINLEVAKKLLEVTGPVELPDYNEVITKDNLYERAEMHSELNFFPGSTQKKDFLSALANQLFIRLTSEDANKLHILKALYASAEESQLLVSLADTTSTQAFQNLGWDGSVRTPECPMPFSEKNCFVDTVMQVEANVGVNKANQHVSRSVVHQVVLNEGSAEHTRTVTLQNHAKSNAWPEGAYKVYFRLIVPANATLTKVMVDGTDLGLSSVRQQMEVGKLSLGFLTNVPISSSSELVVQYSVPLSHSESGMSYALFEQKQSGTTDDIVEHQISTSGKKVVTVAPEPEIEGQILKFRSDRKQHDFMAVEIE